MSVPNVHTGPLFHSFWNAQNFQITVSLLDAKAKASFSLLLDVGPSHNKFIIPCVSLSGNSSLLFDLKAYARHFVFVLLGSSYVWFFFLLLPQTFASVCRFAVSKQFTHFLQTLVFVKFKQILRKWSNFLRFAFILECSFQGLFFVYSVFGHFVVLHFFVFLFFLSVAMIWLSLWSDIPNPIISSLWTLVSNPPENSEILGSSRMESQAS